MRYSSLKAKLTFGIVLIYCLIGSSTVFLCLFVSKRIIADLGANYAKRTVLSEKVDLLSLIEREVTLTKNLVSSPLLKRWCLDESDPNLRNLALMELENYRRSFRDGNYFFIIDKSRNYYYGSSENADADGRFKYRLDPSITADKWYFNTIANGPEISLNLDHSRYLNETKIWINAVVRLGTKNVGMGGTGIDITNFLSNLLNRQEKGVTIMLFDRMGVITAHRNREYVKLNSEEKSDKQITIYDLVGNASDRNRLRSVLVQARNSDKNPITTALDIDGKSYISALIYIPEIRWYTLVLVDAAQLLSIREFAPVLGLLAISLFVVIFVSTLLVNWMVLNPLARLMESSRAITNGDYTVRMATDRADEIGQLTESFNHMAATIDEYTDNLENLVALRTEELERSNKEITDSVEYARMIQSSMLPNDVLLSDYLREYFAIWKPRDIVGGDIYFACEADGKLIISLIDCTGHGIPGALMTMTAIAVVQECINRCDAIDDPGRILHDVNSTLCHVLHRGSSESYSDNGMDIGLAVYLPDKGQVIYSGARMPLIIVSGNGISETRGDKVSVGYSNSDTGHIFENHVSDVADDCCFYMYTDGLVDQPGGERGYSLGRRSLLKLLSEIRHLSMTEQQAAIESYLAVFSEGQKQRDDITILGFKFRV